MLAADEAAVKEGAARQSAFVGAPFDIAQRREAPTPKLRRQLGRRVEGAGSAARDSSARSGIHLNSSWRYTR